MKNSKPLIVLLGVVIAILSVHHSNGQNQAMSYQAYLSSSTTIWERVINQSKSDQFNLAMAQYGFLNATMATKDETAFEKYYDSTVKLLEELIEAEVKTSESRAVLSSVYGLAMAYDSWKGMYLGPKSGGLIGQAFSQAPDNPLVVKLYASSKLYTPEMFGGNPSEAVKQFERSVALFESAGDTTNNWLYLDALAHYGMSLQKMGKSQEAVEVYTKTLAIEPEFKWVKYSLLPAAQKTITSK
ncbi:MAG: tetratricopeptide repeat protein [Marinoscillum sp.]